MFHLTSRVVEVLIRTFNKFIFQIRYFTSIGRGDIYNFRNINLEDEQFKKIQIILEKMYTNKTVKMYQKNSK